MAQFINFSSQSIEPSGIPGFDYGIKWTDSIPENGEFTLDLGNRAHINFINSGLYKCTYKLYVNKTSGNNEFNNIEAMPVILRGGSTRDVLTAASIAIPIYKVDNTASSAGATFIFEAFGNDLFTIEAIKHFDGDSTETISIVLGKCTLILEKLS